MRGARKKLMNPTKPTITQLLKKFEVGDKVHIVLNASSRFQHPRFYGKTGTVVAKTGRHYVVEIHDGSLAKKLILTPENLKSGK